MHNYCLISFLPRIMWSDVLRCECDDTLTETERDQRDTSWKERRDIIGHEWEWRTVIESCPSGRLWGLSPRSQPSIQSSAAAPWYGGEADWLSASLSAVEPKLWDRYWAVRALHEEVWPQITALHQPSFFLCIIRCSHASYDLDSFSLAFSCFGADAC